MGARPVALPGNACESSAPEERLNTYEEATLCGNTQCDHEEAFYEASPHLSLPATQPCMETQQDRSQEWAPAEGLGALGQARNPSPVKLEVGRGRLFDILKLPLSSSLLNSNGGLPWLRSG